MTELASLVLFAADPAHTALFYRALGIPLEPEDHGEGPDHEAADMAGVHVAVYPAESAGLAPQRRAAGSDFIGFYVAALDAVADSLRTLGAPQVGEHEQMPWGCRVVFSDPDGRAVEINDRAHCAVSAVSPP